ncbi:putative carboxypeptidase PM20D1-like [Tropilaelaps mercedesae]|uniref:Putative carboxypeptidase PM20D1-like n=1 Tax=Tropilaelaps mercedesae TaxID=418985 RepID=A0A1V9X4F0_9ACAR|nr:putative carboxypeptidase PM20D1-like [Tropilaelaps mercedesae]
MPPAVHMGLFALTTFLLYLAFRTALLKAAVQYPSSRALEKHFPISIYEGLAEAIRFPTISYDMHSGKQLNNSAFEGLRKYISARFPRIFHNPPEWISHRLIGSHSLLIQVRGLDPGLLPYMLCAHLDVVPVDEKLWTHPPFDGYTDDVYVWGRGALDDKHNVMALLEMLALRVHLKDQPQRGFFIALGHDEEVHGYSGAKTIAKYLQTLKVKLDFIMDEGLVIVQGVVPGVETPIAFIGVAEKGYLTVKIKCETSAKHASMPSQETPITTLSRALSRFTNDAHPAFMTELQESFVKELAPHARFPYDIVYSNYWLFRPLIKFAMSKKDVTNCQMRTTSAVTVIQGGSKENVIPNRAGALVNHRILPGQTVQEVLQHDKDLVKDIPNVSVDIYKRSWSEAIPASPYTDDNFGYQNIKRTVNRIYPEAIVAPNLMIANTDTRHYYAANLTNNIYRFTPVLLSMEDISTIHGNNERISKLNFRRLADFYFQLTRNCDEVLPNFGKKKNEL